jgi:hypothetical protein
MAMLVDHPIEDMECQLSVATTNPHGRKGGAAEDGLETEPAHLLESEGPLIQKKLYERYSEAHDDTVILRYLREKHLPKLEHYGLVEIEQNGSGEFYTLARSE